MFSTRRLVGVLAISILLLGGVSSQRCGGVVTTALGEPVEINYKTNETFADNERCVWTVRAAGGGRNIVKINQLGFPGSSDDHNLILTGMWVKGGNFYYVVKEGSQYTVLGNAVLVTFQTGLNHNNFTGFSISVTSYSSSIGASWDQSIDYVADETSGSLRYPSSGNFGPFDMSVFAFPPLNNVATGTQSTEINYSLVGMQDNCFDAVNVYEFKMSSQEEHKWEDVATLCTNVTTMSFTSSDILLVVFRSSAISSGAGFQLDFTRS